MILQVGSLGSLAVSVRCQDLDGKPHLLHCDGLLVRCIQHEVGRLYVLPLCRRSGLAAALVRLGIERHPGAWEVFALENNQAALAFWRSLLPQLAAWSEVKEPLNGRDGVVWRKP